MNALNTLKHLSLVLLKGALLALALSAATAAVVPDNLSRINPVAEVSSAGAAQA